MTAIVESSPADAFIARWQKSSGAERANFQMFAIELCGLIGVTAPDPARGEDAELNDYCFERGVQFKAVDGTTTPGRIDLYRRGAFVMEAKQSREKGRPKELKLRDQPDLLVPDYKPRGERSANRAWDQLMISARYQAQEYARALPIDHGWPPLVLVCDVGHCIEVFADFSGQGKNYVQFPDRQSYRIYLADLRDASVRQRLKLIWENPSALDPTRQSAKVTREIASRLAEVSKGLEARGHNAEDVAVFLMRCLFTMFAEDVELLPKESFKELLAKCSREPKKFAPLVEQLWKAMDKGDFAYAIEQTVKRFNGKLFKQATALELRREEIEELIAAAKHNWREVEPAIFGTLLEQALDKKERTRFGAHYTPRAYVERLVLVTVMEPLRQEWAEVQATAERFKLESDQLEREAAEAGDRARITASGRSLSAEKAREAASKHNEAISVLRSFHSKLCQTRVLDPACGTGNFLYVSLALMKQLEGEVLEAVEDFAGAQFDLSWLASQNVDPHQFLGLELNPRAAAIAELVIWLGYLQWHFRTKGAPPPEPILHDFKNINFGKGSGYDAVLTWDRYPMPKNETIGESQADPYPNARRPDWPDAEFIVGNPPFIGKGEPMRNALGENYLNTLWSVYDDMNESADFVMYWWDRAAQILSSKSSLRRFGFVTTNSITQAFNRRVVERHQLKATPISIVMAIPDHPWTKATANAAAVRIAMTVAVPGSVAGVVKKVIEEVGLETDQPTIRFDTSPGHVNSDLSTGVDLTSAVQLKANRGLCCPGMQPGGQGFFLEASEYKGLKSELDPKIDRIAKRVVDGQKLIQGDREEYLIDCFPMSEDEVRREHPYVYELLLARVKPERNRNPRESYRANWWLLAEPRKDMRPAFVGISRYIATVRTAKHRVFRFVDANRVCDDSVVMIAAGDPFVLGILSSRIHVLWATRSGGTLEDRPRYNKSLSFAPFPFPDCSNELAEKIRNVAMELNNHLTAQQFASPELTTTKIFNVLEKMRANAPLTKSDVGIRDTALLLTFKSLQEKLDALVFAAYGWPDSLLDQEILAQLVDLNRKRALEEKVGVVKWLRPDYQVPRFGSDAERARLAAERVKAKPDELAFAEGDDDEPIAKPKFQTGNELAETADVMRVLATATEPLSAESIARSFSQGKQVEKRVAVTILALARLGHLSSPDNGETFLLRRSG